MAVIEIRTNDGEIIDSFSVDGITPPLDNGRVWFFSQKPLGEMIVRRVEMAHAKEMGHPTGSRTQFVQDGEEPCLRTGRDREALMDAPR